MSDEKIVALRPGITVPGGASTSVDSETIQKRADLLGLLTRVAGMIENGQVTGLAGVLVGPAGNYTVLGGDVMDGPELIGSLEVMKQRAVMRVINEEPVR